MAWPSTVSLTIITATDQPVPQASVQLWTDEMAAGVCRYAAPGDRREITNAFADPSPYPEPQPPARTIEADAAGRLQLELPSELAVFEVSFGDGAASGLWYARALQHDDAVTVVLYPVGEIAGIVVSVDGSPIGGARVRFQDGPQFRVWDDAHSGRGDARRPADAVSGANGRFVVPAEWLFSGTMAALAPDGWSQATYVRSFGNSPPPIVLHAPGRFRIRGTCVDDAGRPLAGELVTAERGFPARRPEATSDGAGRFELAVAGSGWYSVTARNPGRLDLVLDAVPRVQLAEAAPIADLTLHFIPSASIHGHLRWSDGRPVAKAQVWIPWIADGVCVDRAHHFFDVGSASAADDGSFELRGLRPGRSFELAASLRPDRELGRGTEVLADRMLHGVAAGTNDLEIVFDADAQGGRIVLDVRDAASGESLRDAEAWVTVCLGPEFPSRTLAPPATVSSGSDGAIVLDGLRHTTPYAVMIRSPGHELTAFGPVEVGDEPVKLDIGLRQVATTRITVVDDAGASIAPALVWVLEPPTAPLRKSALLRKRCLPTDASGSVEIDVPVGSETFVQAMAGTVASDVVRVLPASAVDAVIRLATHAQLPGTLDVRVLDEPGHPLPEIEVSLSRDSKSDVPAASLTDADGIAHFPALQPGLWIARCADPDRGYGDEAVPVFAGQHATLVLPTR